MFDVNIDNGLKIVHLNSCVKGDAAKLINHIDANPENSQIRYDLLRKRYDNKWKMLGKMLENMLTVPRMGHESYELLKNLHDSNG